MAKKIVIIIWCFFALAGVGELARSWPNKNLQIVICDVGQGDAALVKWPSGPTILIDAGPDKKVLSCLNKFLPPLTKKIDIIILSHSDADHSGGLFDVLERYDVGQIWYGDDGGQNPAYQAFLSSVHQKNLNLKKVSAGQTFYLGDDRLQILWPLDHDQAIGQPDPNNTSVVVKIFYGQSRWLFVGDIEESTEQWLVNSAVDLTSQFLKVGHHGSKTSSTINFIKTVDPQVATISVGVDNKFGHPSPLTIRRLRQNGTIVYRTDQVGDVVLLSDRQNIYRARCLDFWPFVCYARGTNLN